MTNLRWLLRKVWAHKPLTFLQRCCICGKFGVKVGIHSYMSGKTRGKICWNCELDLITIPKEEE